MTRPRFHALTVTAIHAEAEDAVSVSFAIPAALQDTFAFRPGQYLTVRRPDDPTDVRRAYSLCSIPTDGELRIGVRELPGGILSGWINRELRPGMTLECMPPDGHFAAPLASPAARHVLLIAVGSGITPLLSLARATLAHPDSQVTLLYGNRRFSSLMFREDLEDLKNQYLARFALYCVFSRETQELSLYNGRVDGPRVAEFLRLFVPPDTLDAVCLCGPNAMLDAVEPILEAAGIAPDQIFIERFGGADLPLLSRADIAAPASAQVTLIVDGIHRDIEIADTVSILDAARAAGLDLPFSCKSGVCATCRARVLEGEVRMNRNFALLKADLTAGIVLACQAHPVTARVVLSFDER